MEHGRQIPFIMVFDKFEVVMGRRCMEVQVLVLEHGRLSMEAPAN